MFSTTLMFNGKAAPQVREKHLPPSVMVTVNIDPNTARRRATGWLISEVGNMLKADTGQLVITNQPVWRMPILLKSSKIGTVGQVGTIDVDAVTGNLLVDDELIEEILQNIENKDQSFFHIKVEKLINFCKSLEHQELETLAQKKKFFVCVTHDGLEYIPQSTGIPRKHGEKRLRRVCDEFSRTNSFRPSDYQHLSANASYVLSLIKSYIESKQTRTG